MKELIIKARENEDDMLKLVNDFEPLIKKCVKLYVWDCSFFEDGMQHGRMIVIQCIRQYEINSGYPFEAYVKRGVCYSMRDFGRKLWNNNLSLDYEINQDGSSLIDVLDSGANTENDVELKEEIERLHGAIDRLPYKQKEIITEIFLKGKLMTEICKGRRCHYMTVVSMRDRVLKKLREYMEMDAKINK